jgi:hypothetical protein
MGAIRFSLKGIWMYPLIVSAALLASGSELPTDTSLAETKPPGGVPVGPFAAGTYFAIHLRVFGEELILDITVKGCKGETVAQEIVRLLRPLGWVVYSHKSTVYFISDKKGETIRSVNVKYHGIEPPQR